MKDNFRIIATEANTILSRDFNMTLNFKGYESTINDCRYIETMDLYNLNILIKNVSEWSSYLSELKNTMLYYQDLYKAKIDIYEFLLFQHKKKDLIITTEIRNKYKILKSSYDDILEELETKMKVSKSDYNKIRKLNNLLESRIRFFERIFYKLVRDYGKNLFKLHFA